MMYYGYGMWMMWGWMLIGLFVVALLAGLVAAILATGLVRQQSHAQATRDLRPEPVPAEVARQESRH